MTTREAGDREGGSPEGGSGDARLPLEAQDRLHREELQRLSVQLMERVRLAEVARFRAEESLERAEAASEAQAGELAALRKALDDERSNAARATAELAALHTALDDAQSRAASATADAQRLSDELRAAGEALGQAARATAELERRLSQADARHAALEAERRGLREELGTARGQLAEAHKLLESLRAEHERAGREVEDLRAQLQADAERHAGALSAMAATLASREQDVVRYRSALVEAERRADAVGRTLSFRLGHALIHDTKSWEGLRRLPATLWAIRKDARQRRAGRAADARQEDSGGSRERRLVELESLFAREGPRAAERFARQAHPQCSDLAGALTRLARLELMSNAREALRLAREAVLLDPRPFRRKWLAFLLFDAGHVAESHELLLSLPADQRLKPSESAKAQFIAGTYRLLTGGLSIPERRDGLAFQALLRRVLYVASSSLPYHVTGYTSRTQSVVRAIQRAGWDVVCVTRPGYPDDRPDARGETLETSRVVDGVRYDMLIGPHRRKTPPDRYVKECAAIVEAKARELRPAVIHAASNHEAAIPALIAARRLGIPFAYEVRGLWEYTSASKIPDWEQTERFALDRQLETLAASEADQVFTLTQGLANELAARGVNAGRIALAPNGVDPSGFPQIVRERSLAESLGIGQSPFTVGYIGSVVAYEGLDDLVAAFALVVEKVEGARLLVVGDGDALPALRAQARALGLEAAVAFAGKVPPADVPRYFALLDAVALPRKPVKVCELVSPLKPLEAMATGVPLVVSDVGALREMVRPDETALVHPAGDASSLAESLLRLATDRQLAARLAEAARRDALANRTWDRVVAGICRSYETLAGSAAGVAHAPARAAGRATGAVAAAPVGAFAPVPLPPGRSSMTAAEKALLEERLSAALAAGGVEGMEFLLARQTEGRSSRFAAFCQVKAAAAALAAGHEVDAVRVADAALGLDAGLATVRGAARVYHNAARLGDAGRLVERLVAMQDTLGDGDRRFVEEVRGRRRLAAWAEEPPALRRIPVVPGRVLNLLAFSLPYTSVGYATRSHGLAVGIRNAGWDIRPYTRPGFPYDFRLELEGQALPEQDEIDGITYRRIFETERRGRTEVDYLVAAIRLYEGVIAREQPQVVHAASNYVTALPALIAARRLGVPFVYEVRGFWEVTRSSRDEVFENTPKYRFMQLYEGLVARHADAVVTITTAMKEELVARGVREDAISIAYNSVDPDRFVPRPPDRALAERLGIPEGVPVIGYIGSFVDYEGLDDLVTAAGELMRAGHDFRLLLVGDGAALDALRTQVATLGLEGRCILTGRVPFEQVDDYYSLIDVAPFPRKPWKVCEMVSPLKPFEAMALQKAVVVSGTRALTEIVEDGRNGLVFEKGNVVHLAELLRDLILDPQRRRALGEAAREWITSVRSWDAAGRVCGEAYEDAIRRANGASGEEGFERGTAAGGEGPRRVEAGV